MEDIKITRDKQEKVKQEVEYERFLFDENKKNSKIDNKDKLGTYLFTKIFQREM